MKDLYDQAAEVACYYRVYSSYGGNAKAAVRALRRRMPGSNPAECEAAREDFPECSSRTTEEVLQFVLVYYHLR